MTNLPFWFDDLEVFYYMPEHVIVTKEELYEKYGLESTELIRCKAWWNTNIPMDKFVPTIVPCKEGDADVDEALMNFLKRVKQRSEGKFMPTPPELNMKAGILIVHKNNPMDIKGFIIHLPQDASNILRVFSDGGIVTKTFITGEVMQRDSECLYWDMLEGKYV